MNATATNFLNKLGLGNVKGDTSINDVVKMLHRGGSGCKTRGGSGCKTRGGSRRRRKRHTRKNKDTKFNKKYTWPFW